MATSNVTKDTHAASKQKIGTAELLFRSAQEMGLSPSWITPDGLFAISVNNHERYVNFARSPLNSDTAASLAKNKYLTRRILERHNMHNIPYAHPLTLAEAKLFLKRHGKIIAKPITGSGSRDIHIVTMPSQFEGLNIADYILEKYIVGKELRYLILNDSVIGVHRSDYGVSVKEDRPLQRISYPAATWDPALVSSSLKIARILDLKFAAVDYLIDSSGQAHILEVNTTPGLKWFHAPTSGPIVDVARQFLSAVFNDSDESPFN